MDKMLYVAMSGAKQAMLSQNVRSNNLANASTTAFKKDFEQVRSMPVYGEQHPSRVYAMTESPSSNYEPGTLSTTGRELDLAIKGEGWFTIRDSEGEEAFSRDGNFSVTADGTLTNSSGQAVMGLGGPIIIPPAEKIEFGTDGVVSIRALGQGPNALTEIGRMKLVNPDIESLTKSSDGLFRTKDGLLQPPDGGVQMVTGMLEESNVNVVDEMMSIISSSRRFEMQIKLMKKADEMDAAAARLLQNS